MNDFQAKRNAKIERLRERAERLDAESEKNGFGIFSEDQSGIPFGQPILVGHHSEKRHRRHLERLETRLRRGIEAGNQAQRLRERAAAAENNTSINSLDPDAMAKLKTKLERLIEQRDTYKKLNKLVRQSENDLETLVHDIKTTWPNKPDAESLAKELLTPDFCGRLGIPSYRLTNLGAEIRRLEKRLKTLAIVQNSTSLEPYNINGVTVELLEGRICVRFQGKPNENTRKKLKSSPLCLHWTPSIGCWTRKHTETTMPGTWFDQTLRKTLEEVTP